MAKKKSKLVTAVTIRQIEDANPCSGEYIPFLLDMKSKPIPDGVFVQNNDLGRDASSFPKRSKYGPDTPIPLFAILDTPSRGMQPGHRVLWILENVAGMRDTRDLVSRRVDEITEDPWDIAVREVLNGAA